MAQWIHLFLFSLLNLAQANAHGGGDTLDLKDPPGFIKFQTIQIAEAKLLVNPGATQDCHPVFRKDMESNLQTLWQQCKEIGQFESSRCQRDLFTDCAQSAQEIQRIEIETCARLRFDAKTLSREQNIQTSNTQRIAQNSAKNLNRSANRKTLSLIEGIQRNKLRVEEFRKRSSSSLKDASCSRNTSFSFLKKSEESVERSLKNTNRTLAIFEKIKKMEASQEKIHHTVAKENLEQLKSLVGNFPESRPSPSLHGLDPAALEIESTGTALSDPPHHTVKEPATTSISLLESVPLGTSPPKVRMSFAPPAATTDQDFSDDGSTAEIPPEIDPNSIEALTFTAEERMARSLNIKIDRAFTDRERAKIITGISMIPECQRENLRGLRIEKKNLPIRGKKCVAGQFHVGQSLIEMSSKCNGIQVGVTVHEIFHFLGDQKGEVFHKRYVSTYNKYQNCPVSEYARSTNSFYEDFAEVGRIVVFPLSENRFSGSCVNRKLDKMVELLNSCQNSSQRDNLGYSP